MTDVISILIYSLNVSYLLIFLVYRISIIVKDILAIDYIILSTYEIGLEVVNKMVSYDDSKIIVG